MDRDQLKLKIVDFNIAKERDAYQEIVSREFKNPYYYLGYLLHHLTPSKKIIAFLFEKDSEPLIVMPMILNSIDGTEYYDVISPYGYSGPLFKEDIKEHEVAAFWKEVDAWYSKNNVITEFLRFSLTENHIGYTGNTVETLKNVCGSLANTFDEQWASFNKKVRNNYRKAQSFDLSFKLFESNDLNNEVIDSFYSIYHKTMVRNNAPKFLFFSAEFFRKIVMEHKDDFTIGISYHENVPVSTELHIHYNGSVYAFLGGTDSDLFHTRPNDFLRVEVIKWAIENGKKKYILGGGIKDNDGLYKSKKAFFPKDEDCTFYTGRKVINKEVYDTLVAKAIKEHSLSKDETYFPLYRLKQL